MITLQLKRTEKSISDSSIGSLVLEKGEPFLLIEEDRKLLFIGDGETVLSNFYENRKFVSITNFVTADQILSIPADALPEGLATIAQLEQLEEEINGSIGNINTALGQLDSKIDTSKLFYATCDTTANVATKTIQIDVSEEERTSDFTGVSFVVKFNYANAAENPILQVNDLLNNSIISGPIYIGSQPLSGVFNWVSGDTLIFTYYDEKMNMAGTSASQKLANWCSENDATLINGGMIATGSITADKIRAGSITADQIAVGSLPASVLSQQFSAALNNLNFIEQQAASSKQVVCQCDSSEEAIIKDVYLTDEGALAMSISDGSLMYGTSLVIKFAHGNKSTEGCSLRLWLNGEQFPAPVNVIPPIGYYDNDNIFHGLVYNEESSGNDLNWTDDETRVLIYDGAHWIIQPPSGYLRRAADWCLQNNQTFIQGGSIIAGRISCAQLDAGYIDASRISLNYWSEDSDGRLTNYGGFSHYDGSTTTSTTKGVVMYGQDPDCNVTITNAGFGINFNGGYIRGWEIESGTTESQGRLIMSASNRIEINTKSSSGNIIIGRSDNSQVSTTLNSATINLNGANIKINKPSNSSTKVVLPGLPTSDPNVVGQLWNNSGVLTISNG